MKNLLSILFSLFIISFLIISCQKENLNSIDTSQEPLEYIQLAEDIIDINNPNDAQQIGLKSSLTSFMRNQIESDNSFKAESFKKPTKNSHARKNEKVKICHLDDEGVFNSIEVSINALDAHLAHGDINPDSDFDGFTTFNPCGIGNQDDCNDNDDSIYPGAVDECGDLIDNDCDFVVDEYCDCTAVNVALDEAYNWVMNPLDVVGEEVVLDYVVLQVAYVPGSPVGDFIVNIQYFFENCGAVFVTSSRLITFPCEGGIISNFYSFCDENYLAMIEWANEKFIWEYCEDLDENGSYFCFVDL